MSSLLVLYFTYYSIAFSNITNSYKLGDIIFENKSFQSYQLLNCFKWSALMHTHRYESNKTSALTDFPMVQHR
ncbi:hypothetical protein BDF14DRAFT_1753582 [Spinellus fusiger]|nr:hypothetical protein BDF14DRAFT_1753582 [Spinellus fusiger]